MKDYLLELYDFSCWGRDRILDTAEALTPVQFEQETRFPNHTIKKTLVHALSAEYTYRIRCQQLVKEWLDESVFPDLKSIRDFWVGEVQKMRSYLVDLNSENFAQATRRVPAMNLNAPAWSSLPSCFFMACSIARRSRRCSPNSAILPGILISRFIETAFPLQKYK